MRGLLLTLALLAAMPAAARASTIDTAGGAVTFAAAAGELNRVQISVIPSGVRVEDPGGALQAGTGCTQSAPSVADCPVSGEAPISFSLGDGDDTLIYGANAPAPVLLLRAGDGDDVIDGGPALDNLRGDAGNDTLDGHAGNDVLNGGFGDDRLVGGAGDDAFYANQDAEGSGAGADRFEGGADFDAVDYDWSSVAAGVTVTVGAGADDGLSGEGDFVDDQVERVVGTKYADTLVGNDLPNVLDGLAGDDTLDGRGGDDKLHGGGGADRFLCGAGHDLVTNDSDDTVDQCEEGANLNPAPSGPPVLPPAQAQPPIAGAQPTAKVDRRRRWARVVLGCLAPAPCDVTVKLRSRSGVRLAAGRARVSPGQLKTLRVRLTSRAAKLLRGRRTLKVRVTVAATGGTTLTGDLKLTVAR